jgi:uroporphyrinogen-III synthase
MKNKIVAVLESRFGEHLAELIEKQGATALRAPALAEEPDIDVEAIRRLVEDWPVHPIALAIFQTGVGTRALFEATDRLGLTSRLLEHLSASKVAARGPKPTAVLRGRKVRIDCSAGEPFTTNEVLTAIGDVELRGRRVLVQRYGGPNPELDAALEARGASVTELPTYRWTLPKDCGPLKHLIDELAKDRVDCVVFTSASQVRNLFAVAQEDGRAESLRASLGRVMVASIGPVCSEALVAAGVAVPVEASPPKLGPLVEALTAALTH